MRGSRQSGVKLWPFLRMMRGERILIPLKLAIISPPANCHLVGVSLAGRWWPNIECWLDGLWFSRGTEPVLLRNLIHVALWYFRRGPHPVLPLDPRMDFNIEPSPFLSCCLARPNIRAYYHEIFATVILPLPLFQVGLLTITCTSKRIGTEYWLTA